MSNMNCMSLLEKKVPEFNAVIQKAIADGERPPAAAKALWMECQKRKMVSIFLHLKVQVFS